MKFTIGGVVYHASKRDAQATVRSPDDIVGREGGLGWYIHSKKEYKRSFRKRVFGF